MLRYTKVGYVRNSLATFRAHEGSITINATSEEEKSLKIKSAYKEVKRYYREMKFLRIVRQILG